jgi:hypothetical protein
MLWNRASKLQWIVASIGSSPSKKNRLGTGDVGPSFGNPRNIFCLMTYSGFIVVGRMGRAAKPEQSIGREYVFHRWS